MRSPRGDGALTCCGVAACSQELCQPERCKGLGKLEMPHKLWGGGITGWRCPTVLGCRLGVCPVQLPQAVSLLREQEASDMGDMG